MRLPAFSRCHSIFPRSPSQPAAGRCNLNCSPPPFHKGSTHTQNTPSLLLTVSGAGPRVKCKSDRKISAVRSADPVNSPTVALVAVATADVLRSGRVGLSHHPPAATRSISHGLHRPHADKSKWLSAYAGDEERSSNVSLNAPMLIAADPSVTPSHERSA